MALASPDTIEITQFLIHIIILDGGSSGGGAGHPLTLRLVV